VHVDKKRKRKKEKVKRRKKNMHSSDASTAMQRVNKNALGAPVEASRCGASCRHLERKRLGKGAGPNSHVGKIFSFQILANGGMPGMQLDEKLPKGKGRCFQTCRRPG